MKTRIQALAALALCSTAAFAVTIAKPGVAGPRITPVEAELMKDVQARHLTVGATVFARVTAEWRGTGCALNKGAILEAHVVSVVPHTKAAKGSEIGLAFTKAQCGEVKMGDFGLLLAAVAAPPESLDTGILSHPMPFTTSLGGGFGNIDNLRSSFNANVQMRLSLSQAPLIPQMQMGDVSGIRGLKLSVGTGPGNSSVLTAKDRDVTLVSHSVLLLVPLEGTFPRSSVNPGAARPPVEGSSPGGAVAANTGAPAQPPADDIDLCVPPQCDLALPQGNASEMGSAAATISTRALGYAPRPQRVTNSFDHDEALAYLGPRELLVAFNKHALLPRHAFGQAGWTVRVIHASLVDTETRQVTHSVDWELPDTHQYLWPLDAGRVLVHVGSELRVYGAGLKIRNRVLLDGPLAFVRVTPDGSFVAVGIVRERHTPELHAQLSESLEGDPEEDVEIQVLNRNFEPIAKSTARSGLMAPTLLNEGQAQLLGLPAMRFRISMLAWDSHPSTVARFNSSCTPELSSLAPDLIFLVSCDKQTEEMEYRVLRPNGRLTLKGVASMYEFGYAAQGSANRESFVVKTLQSSRPVPVGALFSPADLTSEELRVYRATDGKRLLGVRVDSPSSSRDGFALAPDGSQLAVMTREQVAFYSVPRQ